MHRRGKRSVRVDRSREALVPVLVEMLPDRARGQGRLLVNQCAGNPPGRIGAANALDLGRVRIRDRAVGCDEKEDVRDAGGLEGMEDSPVNAADLEGSGQQGYRDRPCSEEMFHTALCGYNAHARGL